MVEDQAGQKPEPGRRCEPVAQLDGGGRIVSELLERPPRIDRLRGAVPENDRNLRQDLVEHRAAAILLRRAAIRAANESSPNGAAGSGSSAGAGSTRVSATTGDAALASAGETSIECRSRWKA